MVALYKMRSQRPRAQPKKCTAYTHKRWKNADSDHTDHDSDGDYPGHKVRKEAYDRMVENHKDKIFQKREEAEATRKK
eukprot:21279-Heterocapsa_arctica.AAC.1